MLHNTRHQCFIQDYPDAAEKLVHTDIPLWGNLLNDAYAVTSHDVTADFAV